MTFLVWSTKGSTHAFFPGLADSKNDRTRGIRAPQAGFGHCTVRAQIHAITLASPPPCSSGSFTLGYRCPIRSIACAHPLAVVADILSKTPCSLPHPRSDNSSLWHWMDRWLISEFWWNLDQGFGDKNSNGVKIAG